MPAIIDSTPIEIDVRGMDVPFTITLNSTYASKLIQFSSNDDKSLPFTAPYDTSNASQLITHVDSPLAWVFITGQNGDTYNVRSVPR